MFKKITSALAAVALVSTAAHADYQVKDANNATITIKSRTAAGVSTQQSIPTDLAGNALGVSGNPMQVTLPSGQTIVLGTGAATIGSVNILGGNTVAVKTDASATTQPISAASLPLPAGAATQATVASIATVNGSPTDTPWDGVAASATQTSILKKIWGNISGLLTVDTVVRSTSADRGGTITAGGTAQQFMAANTTRRGFIVQNQSTGDIYVNCLATAAANQSSLKIPAGALYSTDPHHSGTGACTVFGATTAQAFYAREF